MDDNLAIFLVLLVAINAAVVLTVATTWIRAKNRRLAEQTAPEVALLSSENDQLKGQVGRLEERLRVLERIATDPGQRTSYEIEQLR